MHLRVRGGNAIVTVADFSNVTAAVTVNGAFDEIIGGMGDDMLRGTAYSGKIIQGGAGNDTITIADSCVIQTIDAGVGDDLVDIGGWSQEASLGAGADTVQLHGTAGYENKIVDYSYAEGDKVILKEDFQGSETLGSNGQFITGGNNTTTVSTALENSAYKIAVTDSTGKTCEYWRAANGVDSVNFDAAALTADVIIDAAGASSASIALGYGQDTVTLSAGTNTLTVGKASGTDTFATNTLSSDDTLILTGGGTIDDLKFAGNDITYGNTSLIGAAAGALTDCRLQVSTDDGKTTKLVHYAFGAHQTLNTETGSNDGLDDLAATDAGGAVVKDADSVVPELGTAVLPEGAASIIDGLTFSTDINLYVGSAAATDTLLVTGSKASIINLQSQQDIWYLDIDIVDATNAMGQQILIGSADRSSTLIGGTGSTAFWGGSKEGDILQGGSGKNTFWYGTGDGQDTITRSSAGDVLYIYSADFACTSVTVQNGNLVIAGQQGDSLTIKGWTEIAGVNTLRLADSSEYHIYRANDGTIGTRRIQ